MWPHLLHPIFPSNAFDATKRIPSGSSLSFILFSGVSNNIRCILLFSPHFGHFICLDILHISDYIPDEWLIGFTLLKQISVLHHHLYIITIINTKSKIFCFYIERNNNRRVLLGLIFFQKIHWIGVLKWRCYETRLKCLLGNSQADQNNFGTVCFL